MVRLVLWLSVCSLLLTACQAVDCPTVYMKPHAAGVLRIGSEKGLTTLDPRANTSLEALTALHLLYEGLLSAEPDGSTKLALAKTMNVSADATVYTFTLRPAVWSNGDTVTAYDFVNAWKDALNPLTGTSYAYQFFPLKQARAVYEGRAFADEVGVYAPRADMLVVELEKPTPYFLNLLTTPAYFAISSNWIQDQQWGDTKTPLPTNGPFVVKAWQPNGNLVVAKNHNYWNAAAIVIEEVQLVVANADAALELFKADELDWVGAPLGSIPAAILPALQQASCLQTAPADGLIELSFNAAIYPFNNANFRRAFSLAIDRSTLATLPVATGLVPANLGLPPLPADSYDPSQAWLALRKALVEVSQPQLTPLTLCYTPSQKAIAIALQQQWRRVLKAEVSLEECTLPTTKGQIVLFATYATIHSALDFLQTLSYHSAGVTSQTQELLNRAASATPAEQKTLLTRAEQELQPSIPLVPLFEATFDYMAKPRVKDVYLSPSGYLDFRHAAVKRYTIDPV